MLHPVTLLVPGRVWSIACWGDVRLMAIQNVSFL